MTRGEYCKENISTAASDTAARIELAEAILRGRLETTPEQSRGAIAEEISKAAKPATPTTDRRPHGHEPNLARRI